MVLTIPPWHIGALNIKSWSLRGHGAFTTKNRIDQVMLPRYFTRVCTCEVAHLAGTTLGRIRPEQCTQCLEWDEFVHIVVECAVTNTTPALQFT
jgi:hypothetical protein